MKDCVEEGETTNSSTFLQGFKVELVQQSRDTRGVVELPRDPSGSLPLNSLKRASNKGGVGKTSYFRAKCISLTISD